MALFSDLRGTTQTTFRIGAALLKRITGGIAFRNTADTLDERVQASVYEANDNIGLIINADSAGTGADYRISLARPAAGMVADWTLTLPPNAGSAAQVLQTNGAGVTTWTTAGVTAQLIAVDTTTLGFGSASPLALFTTPANAIIEKIQVIIDTPFTGGTPSLTIGITGQTAKYMGATENTLTGVATDKYETNPGLPSTAGEALIGTYAANGASAGSARILVHYVVPS